MAHTIEDEFACCLEHNLAFSVNALEEKYKIDYYHVFFTHPNVIFRSDLSFKYAMKYFLPHYKPITIMMSCKNFVDCNLRDEVELWFESLIDNKIINTNLIIPNSILFNDNFIEYIKDIENIDEFLRMDYAYFEQLSLNEFLSVVKLLRIIKDKYYKSFIDFVNSQRIFEPYNSIYYLCLISRLTNYEDLVDLNMCENIMKNYSRYNKKILMYMDSKDGGKRIESCSTLSKSTLEQFESIKYLNNFLPPELVKIVECYYMDFKEMI
jgi:hypothetical protein